MCCPQSEVPLGNPDVLVCSVGTEIFFEAAGAEPVPDAKWAKKLEQGWDRQQIVDAISGFTGLTMQA